MTSNNVIQNILKAFLENPIRLTYSFARLQTQFSATREEILEAKSQFKNTITQELEEDFTGMKIEKMWIGKKGVSYQLGAVKDNTDTRDEFVQVLKDVLTNTKSNYKPSPYKTIINGPVLLVYTSDKHIGAMTSSDAMFDNEYNGKIFKERFDALLQEIVLLDSRYKFDKIIIFDLGDCIDGFYSKTVKGTQLNQNLTNKEVFKVYTETHLDFFKKLHDFTECKLGFYSAGISNHGGDVEWVMHKSLGTVLSMLYPEMDIFIGEKFLEHITVGNHDIIFTHGKDDVDLKFGMPKNLDPKTELYLSKYAKSQGLSSKFLHCVKGDLHLACTDFGEFLRYKNVLSFYGQSKWVQANFMTNLAGVSMDIISDDSVTEHHLFFNTLVQGKKPR